jgi:hypothetical protein
MPSNELELDALVLRLGEQMGRAEISLFTGAGFSFGARDGTGRPIPQVDELRREIWELVWPDDPFDDNSTLQDTYAAALAEARNRLSEHLRTRLRVDPDTVPDAIETWLSMPWRRAYTVNIDDLETAAARRFNLRRPVDACSALSDGPILLSGSELVVVHLNGTIEDIPDVTFTDPQYGRRLGQPNSFYEQLAAELLSYPVVFVGTTLREPLFWQYVTLRDERGARGVSEQRPGSYLVSPSLPQDRRRLLAAYNIRWIPLSASDFADAVLSNLREDANKGFELLRASASSDRGALRLPTVQQLATLPQPPDSEYLLGAQPRWDDIRSDRAVPRAFEENIPIDAARGTIVVTGTAGAGTSTTLMRVGLRLVGQNRDVRWIDADNELDVHDVGRWLRRHEDDIVIVIDDADTFGRGLQDLVADAQASMADVLLVLGMRAIRLQSVLTDWTPNPPDAIEINIPHLEDPDIELLLTALEANNRLGILKPLSHGDRVGRIRQNCGRELLVAMFEATTGERFEVKLGDEFNQLEPEQKLIYAIVGIATDLRAFLLRDEVLMASGDLSNTSLYALDRLIAGGLVYQDRGRHRLRHRRIAELVVGRLRNSAELLEPYRGLLRTMSTRYRTHGVRSREHRLFTALVSHTRIGHTFSVDDARSLYQDLEASCADDYHYWLQRGSFEVQFASLSLARTWLAQAKAGDGADDFRVRAEWGYYLLKSARTNPTATDAPDRLAEGKQILEDCIQAYRDDTHASHIYGSQVLGWARSAPLSDEERALELRGAIAIVRAGVDEHPGVRDLEILLHDLEGDLLELSVSPELRRRH